MRPMRPKPLIPTLTGDMTAEKELADGKGSVVVRGRRGGVFSEGSIESSFEWRERG